MEISVNTILMEHGRKKYTALLRHHARQIGQSLATPHLGQAA
ncbi:hypothetical protein [Hymenobacter sp. APR13]|nr:hypothetical protein [Hymenobacter sp. APR13]